MKQGEIEIEMVMVIVLRYIMNIEIRNILASHFLDNVAFWYMLFRLQWKKGDHHDASVLYEVLIP